MGDDVRLMRRLVAGDPEALRRLHDRYADLVMAVALRILRDRAEAEEVLGDVFLSLWISACRYDETRGSPATFIALLARSRAIDRARRIATRRRALLSPRAPEADRDPAGADEDRHDPLAEALAQERRHRVRAALTQLDEDRRRVIEMSFYQDLSHAQIAAETGQPLGTVKARIRRTLRRLRPSLEASDGRES